MQQLSIPIQTTSFIKMRSFAADGDTFDHNQMTAVLRARYTWETSQLEALATVFVEPAGFLVVETKTPGVAVIAVATEYYLIGDPVPKTVNHEIEITVTTA